MCDYEKFTIILYEFHFWLILCSIFKNNANPHYYKNMIILIKYCICLIYVSMSFTFTPLYVCITNKYSSTYVCMYYLLLTTFVPYFELVISLHIICLIYALFIILYLLYLNYHLQLMYVI